MNISYQTIKPAGYIRLRRLCYYSKCCSISVFLILLVKKLKTSDKYIRFEIELTIAVGCDHGTYASRKNRCYGHAELFLESVDYAVEHSRMTYKGTGSHTVDGIGAEYFGFTRKVDIGKLGSL